MRPPTREPIALRLPLEQVKLLRQVSAETGIPIVRQIEFALRDWFEERGYRLRKLRKKAERQRAVTRKRS